MKTRLLTALVTAAFAALVGVGVVYWQHLPSKVAIVLVVAAIGFVFGLVFKFRVA